MQIFFAVLSAILCAHSIEYIVKSFIAAAVKTHRENQFKKRANR